MEKETLGVFATFGGVALGFFLSQAAEWNKSRRMRKNIRKAVRLLIILEIKKNYRLLVIYWGEVKRLAAKNSKEDEEKNIPLARYAYAIGERPFPLLSRSVWDRHLEKLSEAFLIDEITRVWDFYEDLAQLARLHESIASLRNTAEIGETNGEPLAESNAVDEIMLEKPFEGAVKYFKLIIEGILKYGLGRILPAEPEESVFKIPFPSPPQEK
jgi:hypothetical protein